MHHPSFNETVDVNLERTAMWVIDGNIKYDMTVMIYEGLNTIGTEIEQGTVEPGGDSKY